MTDSSDNKKMIGGYGSDDKVEMETGDQVVDDTNKPSDSQVPGVVADVSAETSNKGKSEPSSPAGALERGSNATNVDNLSGGATDYTSGGGTSGFGKGE